MGIPASRGPGGRGRWSGEEGGQGEGTRAKLHCLRENKRLVGLCRLYSPFKKKNRKGNKKETIRTTKKISRNSKPLGTEGKRKKEEEEEETEGN